MPRLTRDAPVEEDPFAEHAQPQPLLAGRIRWTAIMSWGFALVVLLLVVAPTDALSKLTTRSASPISAAGYGPLMAVFAILAIVIAFGGLLWIWIAMSRDHEAGPDEGSGL